MPVSSVDRRRWRWYALAFAGLALLANAVIGERGYLELRRTQQRHAEAVARLDEQRARNRALRDQVRRLKSDPAAIEREIRAQLGYVRPGELVFTVRDGAPATPQTGAGAGESAGDSTGGATRR